MIQYKNDIVIELLSDLNYLLLMIRACFSAVNPIHFNRIEEEGGIILLTKDDLRAISELLDEKLEKLEQKFDTRSQAI